MGADALYGRLAAGYIMIIRITALCRWTRTAIWTRDDNADVAVESRCIWRTIWESEPHFVYGKQSGMHLAAEFVGQAGNAG